MRHLAAPDGIVEFRLGSRIRSMAWAHGLLLVGMPDGLAAIDVQRPQN